MAPTDKSMPPEMMMKVAPTAMMAMKLVSLASWVRFCAFRNLFFSISTGSVSPAELRRVTRSGSPASLVRRSGTFTEPPKMASRRPSRRMTRSRPPSWKRTRDRRGRAVRGSAAEFMCWGPTLPSVQMNEQSAFLVWRRGHMRRIHFNLEAAVAGALSLKTGVVGVKGPTQFGGCPARVGSVAVRCKEYTDASTGQRDYGVAVEV